MLSRILLIFVSFVALSTGSYSMNSSDSDLSLSVYDPYPLEDGLSIEHSTNSSQQRDGRRPCFGKRMKAVFVIGGLAAAGGAYGAYAYLSDQQSPISSLSPSAAPFSGSNSPSTIVSFTPSEQIFHTPSGSESEQPSFVPSMNPSSWPSYLSSLEPSTYPSIEVSEQKSQNPSSISSEIPSVSPSLRSSAHPSKTPSLRLSIYPSVKPSEISSQRPSSIGSNEPSVVLSTQPSQKPSSVGSNEPSADLSAKPSTQSSQKPSAVGTNEPSIELSAKPSTQPSVEPSFKPSTYPSYGPSKHQSMSPTILRSEVPSNSPSYSPSFNPSQNPTFALVTPPSDPSKNQPSFTPTSMPTFSPSSSPSETLRCGLLSGSWFANILRRNHVPEICEQNGAIVHCEEAQIVSDYYQREILFEPEGDDCFLYQINPESKQADKMALVTPVEVYLGRVKFSFRFENVQTYSIDGDLIADFRDEQVDHIDFLGDATNLDDARFFEEQSGAFRDEEAPPLETVKRFADDISQLIADSKIKIQALKSIGSTDKIKPAQLLQSFGDYGFRQFPVESYTNKELKTFTNREYLGGTVFQQVSLDSAQVDLLQQYEDEGLEPSLTVEQQQYRENLLLGAETMVDLAEVATSRGDFGKALNYRENVNQSLLEFVDVGLDLLPISTGKVVVEMVTGKKITGEELDKYDYIFGGIEVGFVVSAAVLGGSFTAGGAAIPAAIYAGTVAKSLKTSIKYFDDILDNSIVSQNVKEVISNIKNKFDDAASPFIKNCLDRRHLTEGKCDTTADVLSDIAFSGKRIGTENSTDLKSFGKATSNLGKSPEIVADAVSTGKGKIGAQFENHLTSKLGGEGSFKASSQFGKREFDGKVGKAWYEAKSGRYWDKLDTPDNPTSGKFKSISSEQKNIAEANGATFQIISNTPIRPDLKNWLDSRGIPYVELSK